MSERTEHNLDMALAALAREAQPQPARELADIVLADAALTVLAREVTAATPRPGHDLVARVLGDAAEMAAERNATARTGSEAQRTRPRPIRTGLMERLFGWQIGAVATMMLALGIGFGVGLELDPSAVPILADGQEEMTIALAALDGSFMEGNFMGLDGL